ncbi:unnamed protein product [Durusdinium trenchii]|uniref:Pentatricopeptide repeat-containing protein n=1 Tax=Durusdinium trenchii TaxID=1381693 RepID=A0ABP0I9F4_9DINO
MERWRLRFHLTHLRVLRGPNVQRVASCSRPSSRGRCKTGPCYVPRSSPWHSSRGRWRWPLPRIDSGDGIEVPQLALDSQRSPLGPELVQSLRRGVQWEQALWLARGWPRGTTETWFAAAGNCAIARAWQQAFYGLGRLRHHGLQLSTDALRQAFVLQRPLNPWKGSLKLLRMIRRAFLRPSIIEFNKIFLSCARFSWSYTLYFLSLQRTEACEVDDASLSTALSAFCLKFRPWQYACEMLRSFQANARCSNLGLRTLNSALGVFAKRPLLWKKAMQMAMAFERSPYVPDAPARQAIRVARARRTAAFRRLCRITASWQEAISTLERLRLGSSETPSHTGMHRMHWPNKRLRSLKFQHKLLPPFGLVTLFQGYILHWEIV